MASRIAKEIFGSMVLMARELRLATMAVDKIIELLKKAKGYPKNLSMDDRDELRFQVQSIPRRLIKKEALPRVIGLLKQLRGEEYIPTDPSTQRKFDNIFKQASRFDRIAGRVAKRVVAKLSKKQKQYREYFEGVLAKYGVDSPADLSEEKKKEFFNEIDKGWDAGKNETD